MESINSVHTVNNYTPVHFFNNMSTSVNGGPYVRLAPVPDWHLCQICYPLEIKLLLLLLVVVASYRGA